MKNKKFNSTVKKIVTPVISTTLVIFIAWIILQLDPNLESITVPGPYGEITLTKATLSISDVREGLHGLTYTDVVHGYQISAPNEKWKIYENIPELFNKLGYSPEYFLGENFTGGVVLYSSQYDALVMLVIDKISPTLNLNELIEYELDKFEEVTGMQPILKDQFVSIENNYAIFEAEIPNQNRDLGKEILRKHGDFLFTIVTFSDPPESITNEEKNEINKILESFRFLST